MVPFTQAFQAQARFGGVGAGLRADPVDRPSGGERGDLVLEAGAVRWREVGGERGVNDADGRVCRGGCDEGGQKRGGVSGVDRGGRACRGGAEGAVEEEGAAGVVGPDQGAEPGRVIGVKRVQRVEVYSGPPGDVRGGPGEGGGVPPRSSHWRVSWERGSPAMVPVP